MRWYGVSADFSSRFLLTWEAALTRRLQGLNCFAGMCSLSRCLQNWQRLGRWACHGLSKRFFFFSWSWLHLSFSNRKTTSRVVSDSQPVAEPFHKPNVSREVHPTVQSLETSSWFQWWQRHWKEHVDCARGFMPFWRKVNKNQHFCYTIKFRAVWGISLFSSSYLSTSQSTMLT